MYRVAILFKNGKVSSKNVNTQPEAEDFVLEQTNEIKVAYLENKELPVKERREQRERIY